MKTLEDLERLEESGFGRPCPRHGLRLLYWFATNCLKFNQNNKMKSCCRPERGDFGFHVFENKSERRFGKLLPDVPLPYYEVGNLSKVAANMLPSYVRENYTRLSDDSNMDRIIVSCNKNTVYFNKVYVTRHRDRSNFDGDSTYIVSKRLIKMIRDLTLEEFLLKTSASTSSSPEELSDRHPPSPVPPTTFICRPVPDVCPENQSPRHSTNDILEEHHKTPPKTFTCISARISSTHQDRQTEIESTSSMTNYTQGHHKAPPTPSICTPAPTSFIHQENKSSPSFIKKPTKGHHEAPPTLPICGPTSTPTLDQDVQQEGISDHSFIKNHMPGHQKPYLAQSIHNQAVDGPSTKDIHLEVKSPIMMKKQAQECYKVSPKHTASTTQYINPEVKSSPILIMNPTQGHHGAPPTPSTYILVPRSSTDQNNHLVVLSSPTMMKSHTQGHHGAPPTPSTYILVPRSSTDQNNHLVVLSSPTMMKSHTQGHHEAPPTPFMHSPTSTSPTNRDACAKNESSLAPEDIPTPSTCKPSIKSSKVLHRDTKSSPLSQLNAFFWGFYFLCVFCFFYFFWGIVLQIFIIVAFATSLFPQQDQKSQRGEKTGWPTKRL